MAADTVVKELRELKYDPILYPNGFVGFKYTIPHGRFRNQEVEIVLEVKQFPDIPPSGPYIKPYLLPITGNAGTHPFGGIHQRNKPSVEFQYWSRPFPEWDKTDKNMQVYLAFLRTLFDFE